MKISKITILTIPVLAILLLSGCTNQPTSLYNYGNYSDSYYNYKKNMSEESALEYQKSIEMAIENAKESRSGRVAPGMYANLGYIYLKSGKTKEAIENFKYLLFVAPS